MLFFEKRLKEAIEAGKLENFLIGLKRTPENIKNVNKYSDYMIKNSFDYEWLYTYFSLYDAYELLSAISQNFEILQDKFLNLESTLEIIYLFPEEKITDFLSKTIERMNNYFIEFTIYSLNRNNKIMDFILDNYLLSDIVGVDILYSLIDQRVCLERANANFLSILKKHPEKSFKFINSRFVQENLRESLIEMVNSDENYLDYTVKSILREIYNDNYNEKDFKPEIDTIKIIIREVCQNENVGYGAMHHIGTGSFSYVLQIGNKVLKIGEKRRTETFKNNPYIVKPLLREHLVTDNNQIVFLELTEKAQNKPRGSEKDVTFLYNKLRDIGIYWDDAYIRNIGILQKDNDIYWHEDIKPTDESLELAPFTGDEQLMHGDYVVIDADYLYDANDPKIKQKMEKSYYEKLYQEQKHSKR